MQHTQVELRTSLPVGFLRRVHHIALNVQDMQISRQFYGSVLGLHELTGTEVPETLRSLVEVGKVANFVTPDGTVLDLFWEPDLTPPNPDPHQQFTRANHLAFDIDPDQFEQAVAVLKENNVLIDHGPVTRPTGRGIYFYDPDGFLLEIRCDPQQVQKPLASKSDKELDMAWDQWTAEVEQIEAVIPPTIPDENELAQTFIDKYKKQGLVL